MISLTKVLRKIAEDENRDIFKLEGHPTINPIEQTSPEIPQNNPENGQDNPDTNEKAPEQPAQGNSLFSMESLNKFWNDYKNPIGWFSIPFITSLIASKKNKLSKSLLWGLGGLGLKYGMDYLTANNPTFKNFKDTASNWLSGKITGIGESLKQNK